ncbi:hypothetical protein [Candidatus Endoriftia persephonae]|jgi:hypothetical protein|uniref:Uncharacterized protein n=1 Tax=Candidatus Endoriftia persephonae TaxID=393765 RepID=A0A9J6ZUD9_9GAMM|nr:hypothetical protein [Candidatus Endoriftia persephone]USF86401.1 hypothetical protein L0Y14_09610 [Candidatus Endoriftia persephone]
MDKTAYVLIGVVLGVFLNAIKEWWFKKGTNKKELEYLAIRISCILDTFVNGCADVIADDGLCYGQPDKDGYRSIQTKTPDFDPLSVEVEWKSLKAEIMYEVLNFPNQIQSANHKISGAFEYAASPPDYEEGFEERQLQYATLGLKAYKLATKLRTIGNLPAQATPGKDEWNPIQFMEQKIKDIEKLQKERSSRNQALMQNLNTSA